jgi:hypothetical protein
MGRGFWWEVLGGLFSGCGGFLCEKKLHSLRLRNGCFQECSTNGGFWGGCARAANDGSEPMLLKNSVLDWIKSF